MQNYLRPDRELQVDGHLDIEGPRGRLTLAGSGQTIILAADSLGSFLDLLGAGPGSSWNLPALRKVHSQLASSGVALELRKGNHLVGRIGRKGRPMLAAICLGIGVLLSRLPIRNSWRAR